MPTPTQTRLNAGNAIDTPNFGPILAQGAPADVTFGSAPANNNEQMLQDPFLNTLRKEHVPVSIYLVNGIKLQGQIESFDQYVVLLKNTVTQMVYKHAISTVVPARSVAMPHSAPSNDTEA